MREEEKPSYNEDLNDEGEDSSYLEGGEEEGEEEMFHENLYWMAQGPLSLMHNIDRIPKHPEKCLSKFDLDKKTKS